MIHSMSLKELPKILFLFLTLFLISSGTIFGYDLESVNKQEQENLELREKIDKIEKSLPVYSKTVIGGDNVPYTLGKADVVEIVVRNQPEFSGRFRIGPKGNIQYFFVGDVKVEGLNKDELKEELYKKLTKFVKNPEISVSIIGYNSKFVYILGEVGRPGKYPMRGDVISLRDAIVGAGLVTSNAVMKKVLIIKSDAERPQTKKINLHEILYKGKMKNNIDLVNSDIVVVPCSFLGKVTRGLSKILAPATQARDAVRLGTPPLF